MSAITEQVDLCPVCNVLIVEVTCLASCCSNKGFQRKFCQPCFNKHLERPRPLNRRDRYLQLAGGAAMRINDFLLNQGIFSGFKWKHEEASYQSQSAASAQQSQSVIASFVQESSIGTVKGNSRTLQLQSSLAPEQSHYVREELVKPLDQSSSYSSLQEEVKIGEKNEYTPVLEGMSSFKERSSANSKKSISQKNRDNDSLISLMSGENGIQKKVTKKRDTIQQKDANILEQKKLSKMQRRA
ncbi:hypothetical protein FGO68_gene6758 [Halteria grandinella]|uniref:Uncharacterized protein n=1 Tax=Halteria grandinella TaxID=5974 RepID=A0A8J8NLN7_HALGN|nr:hypothetical protein FGO68_gene6758 [Halteria grandinella]